MPPRNEVLINAVWLWAAFCMVLGLPIFKPDVISTAIISISTIGWVGSYAVTDLDEAGNR